MNVMLQRHCARYIYVVPEGLKELMNDISREVIRSQPENTYTFIADYLDALLITRENARVAARMVQSITEIARTTADFLERTGMDRAEADRVVIIIQRAFRKYLHMQIGVEAEEEQTEEVEEANVVSDIIHEANITLERGEEAARIIQNAYRKFKLRRDKERELLTGMIDWRIAARSAIYLYRKTGVTYEEANRAATLIKAAYKGYYTRRLLKKLAMESRMLQEEPFEEEEGEGASEHDQKSVKINYDTVIPHVDFDESGLEGESTEASLGLEAMRGESTTSAVVGFAVEGILQTTFKEVGIADEEIVLEEPKLEMPPEGDAAPDDMETDTAVVKAEPVEPGEAAPPEAGTEGEQPPVASDEAPTEAAPEGAAQDQGETAPADGGAPLTTEEPTADLPAEAPPEEPSVEAAPSEPSAEAPPAEVPIKEKPLEATEEIKTEEIKTKEIKTEEITEEIKTEEAGA